MKALVNIVRELPRYLWSGWGALASLFLFIAAWEWGYQSYGQLVLSSPLHTFAVMLELLQDGPLQQEILLTLRRALSGFLLALVIGSVCGLLAGLFVTTAMLSRPLVTILMGTPPIAWIVLAMMWFGMSDTTVVFTVVIAAFPMVFLGVLQGTRTQDNTLSHMADSFATPLWMKSTDLYFPHLFSYAFPAWITALGTSWKIVIMAELLASSDGIGAALALARTQLDTARALALVAVMVTTLLLVEYLLMEPIKREVESWRQ